MSGMTEGAIDNGGHDRRGRKTSGVTEGGRLTTSGMTEGKRVGESMFEQEKDGSEEPESVRPEPKLIPLGFFC